MDVHVRDAYQDLRKISREVSRMRKKLYQILRKKENLKQLIVNQLDREMNVLRTKHQTKHEKKVKHLRNKFGDNFDVVTQCPVPDHLKAG